MRADAPPPLTSILVAGLFPVSNIILSSSGKLLQLSSSMSAASSTGRNAAPRLAAAIIVDVLLLDSSCIRVRRFT